MRLQLTVTTSAGRGGPSSHELEVEAAQGASADELVAALSAHLGAEGVHLSCGGRPVPGTCTVGAPPLVDGAALTLGPAPPCPPRPVRLGTPVQLLVAHGPDAGRTIGLEPGTHTVGRSPDADICLDDPRLSRVHAELHVSADGVQAADLGSTNGTWLDGNRLATRPQALAPGNLLVVGGSVLRLGADADVPAAAPTRPDGTRAVNRRPRVVDPTPPAAVALPAPPETPRRVRVPWVAMLLPIPFAALMAAFFGPMMLAFAVMGPVVMAGTAVSDRVGSRRRYAEESAAHAARLAQATARVEESAAQEVAEQRRAHPDVATVLTTACVPTGRLWERGRSEDDWLHVSLGRCDRPSRTRVTRPPGDDGPEHVVLREVPCVLRWPAVGTLGVCGGRRAVLGLARSVLGQVAALHSPRDVRVALLTAGGPVDDWTWLLRLPHARRADGVLRDDALAVGADEAQRLVRTQLDRLRAEGTRPTVSAAGWRGRWTVLVVDAASEASGVPGLAELTTEGRAGGVLVLVLEPRRASLPPGCGAVLDLTSPGRPTLDLPGDGHERLAVDRVGAWWVDRLSRGLAPLRDAAPSDEDAGIPDRLALGTATGRDLTDAGGLRARWARTPASTAVPVGAGRDGPMVLDLAADGPHVLVGGTTGAGKSEFLRTLVAGLAVHHRPDLLSLVLVDYKGGAAFRECAELPHVRGVVTDLDEHLADRALVSLTAELRRRERLLHAAGVPDFTAYQRHPAARDEPLARLVVVVDEFRALADELPAFVDGMVRFAALGRSLGVHVVLATQRPAGVVTADIKANVNLRIALRMRDAADSEDVVGSADAARIPPTLPGRALCAVAGAAPVPFQAAHVGGAAPSSEPVGLRVRELRRGRPLEPGPTDALSGPPPEPDAAPVDPDGPTELEAIVRAVREASDTLDLPPAPPVWMPPLADRLDPRPVRDEQPPAALVLGMADHPARQAQEEFVVDLETAGHWAFVGGAGSGRTSALLGLASAATARLSADALHVYAVSGGSLAAVGALPQCGTHTSWDDLPRVHRLVERLGLELAERRRALAATGHPSLAAWRAADPGDAPALQLLLLDDWDLLLSRADDVASGALADRLLGLVHEGAGLGLTAAVAGGRALLTGRTAAAVPRRLLLRQSDPADALLAGLPPRALPRHQPPGRGVLPDGTEVQLTVPGAWAPAPEPHGGVRRTRRPIRVEALPSRVSLADLAAVGRGRARRDGGSLDVVPHGGAGQVASPDALRPSSSPRDPLPLGIGGDEGEVVGLDPDRDGRHWLVCGAPRSGVTTALELVLEGASSRGRRMAVVGGALAARAPAGVLVVDPLDPRPLVDLRRSVPDLVVVVDDAHAVVDTPLDPVLREISSLVDRDGGLVVCGADAGSLAGQYRGPAVEVARHRTGLLLGRCGPLESDLLGVRPPPGVRFPPGRGLLVTRGTAVPIQVADPGRA